MRAFPIGRYLGIRVDVHPSWFAVYALVTWIVAGDAAIAQHGRPAALLIGALAALFLFASVVVHEFAHALVARAYGTRTESIALFLFGGIATLEAEPAGPVADFAVALAGPAVSGLLALAAYGAMLGVARVAPPGAAPVLTDVLAYLTVVNAVLAVFNLVPAYPMDGGRVLRSLLWRLRGDRDGATATAALVGIVLATLVAAGGIAAAIVTRTWEFGWYVLLAGYLVYQCVVQYRALRPRPRAAVSLPPAAPAGAATA